MRNRLVFPSGGMETKYVWNKSTINDKGVYVWDKNDVITIDTHYWNKYEIDYNTDVKVYNWDKFKLVRDKYVWYQNEYYTNYTWDKYEAIIDAEDTYTATTVRDSAYTSNRQYWEQMKVLSNTEINKTANDINNNEYIIFPFGTDKDRVFTFYYALPIPQYEIAPIKKASYTAQELYNIVDKVGNELYLNYTTIFGFADSGLENGYADKVIVPSIASGWTGSQFKITENTENPLLSYITIQYQIINDDSSRVDWYDKAIFDNGYYTQYSTVANDYAYEQGFYFIELPYPDNSGETQTTTFYENSKSYLSLGEEAFSTYIIKTTSTIVFYYNYEHIPAVAQKGDFIEQITSTNEQAYPQNGFQDGYWYEFNNAEIVLSTYLGNVNADTADAYPQDGAQDGYYYRFKEYVAVEPTYNWNVYYAEETDEIDYFSGNRYNIATAEEQGLTFYLDWGAFDEDKGWQEPLPEVSYTLTPNQSFIYSTDYEDDLYINVISVCDGRTYKGGWGRLEYVGIKDYPADKEVNLSTRNIIYFLVNGAPYLLTDNTTIYYDSITKHTTLSNITKITFNPSHDDGYNGIGIGRNYRIGNTIDIPYRASDSISTPRYLIPIYVPEAKVNVFNSTTRIDIVSNNYPNPEENDVILDEELTNLLENEFNNYHGNESGTYFINGYCYTIYPTFIWKKKYDTPEYVFWSNNIDEYPRNGYQETGSLDYWFELIGYDEDNANTSYLFVETVSSQDENAYPKNDVFDDYFYEYTGYTLGAPSAGGFIEEVNSLNGAEYPENGIQNDYWYEYTKTIRTFEMGEYLDRVESTDEEAYPSNGILGDYWYVAKGFETGNLYEGKFIQQVETNDANAYPVNGTLGNYWYKYQKEYQGYKLMIDDSNIKGGIDYNIDVNPEEDYIVGTVASAEIAFDYDNTKRDIQKYINANECWYYTWQPNDNDWRKMGVFYLEDITEIRDTINVKAYDNIIKTEKYIDDFISSYTSWPTNLTNFFINLCNYLDLPSKINPMVVLYNRNFINDNFEAVNITGRQLLQYIAEAAGGFIMADADGAIYLTRYEMDSNKSLDKSKYVKYLKHNYTTQAIEGVNVRITSDDMGITAGADSGNVYIIENNPLFFDNTSAATINTVGDLYNQLRYVSYVPAEVELLQDFGINCGDIITVDGDKVYVMSKNLSASGCKLKCVGNKQRQLKESGLNSDIIALRGKTNELYRDLEQTKSTLTDVEADLRTEILQTAEEIKLYASNLDQSLNSRIQVKLDSITSEVNNLEDELTTRIEQTESSITNQVIEQGRVITEIRQDLDGIDLVYNSENGTASITIGDITVTDLVNGEYVTRTVAGIDLTGYVTFHSLETAGATTINGSNITTGTISADRINMTGAITWGDLSSDVQDAIDAGASDDTDIPDYIKSTYIDGARIESPTINGGTLNSVAAYGDSTHTTTIEDSQISFNIREYNSSGGSFGYTAGYIDAYANDVGLPESARTGLRIVAPWNGDGYTGGLTLEANRGMVLNAGQDIFFYIPGHQGVALSTILDKLGL